tara:strand:- start:7986 stop:8900 length:915 start_codon:yes stop_codon:yes gene_type:complete
MNNDIVKINIDNYDAMAKVMGMDTETNSGSEDSKKNNLPRLKLYHSAIMGEKNIDGKKTKVELLSGGSYRIEKDKEYFYGSSATARFYLQRFMYKRFVPASGKNDSPTFTKTIMADSLKNDLKDTKGGFNCGRPNGYIKDFDSLDDKIKKLIVGPTSAKRTRVLFGTIKLNEVVDALGNDASDRLGITPFIWEVDNKDAFKLIGEVYNTFKNKQILPLQHEIKMTSTEVHDATIPHYLPKLNINFNKKIDITQKDQVMFADFIEWVNSYNKYVFSEWTTHSNNDVDKELVEEFIDMEDGIPVVS